MTLQTPPNPLGDFPLLGWKLPSAPETSASNEHAIALLGSPVLNHPFSMAQAMWDSNALGNERVWYFCCHLQCPWHHRFALADTVDYLLNTSLLTHLNVNNGILWLMGRVTTSVRRKLFQRFTRWRGSRFPFLHLPPLTPFRRRKEV